MPESKKRDKVVRRRKAQARAAQRESHANLPKQSPSWWAPVMVAFAVIGLIVVVAAYVTGGQYPIPNAGNWNVGLGVFLMLIGFGMTMGWK
ncbi:MAG: cell division protein CrgA [Actinomycetaceae bacterium]|nr:cell division protein CrgA [Arcanobacterium sp.]MDD7505118.1 cell division protein CrgA [Actinomycetaceae bacterium]MDY6142635.1 cell division protein CrgA [Arcanobacterium sp.]